MPHAADALFAKLYDELHLLAGRVLRRDGGELALGRHTLVHEAFLNVSEREGVAFEDRPRFMGYVARVMRGLVVDHARRRGALRRGPGLEVALTGEWRVSAESQRLGERLAGVGDALDTLVARDPALAQLVDLHFFGGFTFAEIAAARGVSERTVRRDWVRARALLHQALRDD
ncbi:ECF-type sigma factor [Roseisolibacter sp. H3M3-2]|uniref:ECF-type sigma factor n=1 Tax=Roseisolibacter sp. H3M3-2 TaxID=3031323 RepID=UPI0023DC261E|nr:ECF-type sigma factor [Roseisolibacter sp. H3M3-2]MDF1504141.1 ECF-type sigma factor [Roseisolibacter sp. H3M3-2]